MTSRHLGFTPAETEHRPTEKVRIKKSCMIVLFWLKIRRFNRQRLVHYLTNEDNVTSIT